MTEPLRYWEWNVGGAMVLLKAMVAAFEKASGRKVPYRIAPRRAGDIASFYADVTYAEQVLGWRAKRGVAEMCADAWRWEQMRTTGRNGCTDW